MVHGLRRLATQNAMPIGYYKFVIAFVLAAGILCLRQSRRARQLLAENPFAAIFCFLFFAVYLLLYAGTTRSLTTPGSSFPYFCPSSSRSRSSFEIGRRQHASLAAAGACRSPQFFGSLLIGLSLIDILYNVFRS